MVTNHHTIFDVVIIGGGPAGLSAALTLGRSRKRVLLCDAGPRRNAAAAHIQNFVTRDGTPPDDFRRIGGDQLASYPLVERRNERVDSISGESGAFRVGLASGAVEARRVLLCMGMLDELPPIEGLHALWGRSVFQCPYCHGWEVQDRRWGYLVSPADAAMFLPFALLVRGWTRDVVVFTDGNTDVAHEVRAQLETAGIRLETAPVARLKVARDQLEAVELADGTAVPCDVMFMHPPQRQVDLIRSLGVALDSDGYVRVDPMKSETSIAGIYAAGDMTSRMQGAIWAAAGGARAAAMINFELTTALPNPHRAHEHAAGHHHHAFVDAGALSNVLDDPARDVWQLPAHVIRALELTPRMAVADVGAGTGYFAVRLARALPEGDVIATDVEPTMVGFMTERARRENLPNLRALRSTRSASGLAARTVDRILVVHVWHHIEGRTDYARDLAAALRPDGRLLVVDFSPGAGRGPPEAMRVGPDSIIAELAAVGLTARVLPAVLPDQYIVEARRAAVRSCAG